MLRQCWIRRITIWGRRIWMRSSKSLRHFFYYFIIIILFFLELQYVREREREIWIVWWVKSEGRENERYLDKIVKKSGERKQGTKEGRRRSWNGMNLWVRSNTSMWTIKWEWVIGSGPMNPWTLSHSLSVANNHVEPVRESGKFFFEKVELCTGKAAILVSLIRR